MNTYKILKKGDQHIAIITMTEGVVDEDAEAKIIALQSAGFVVIKEGVEALTEDVALKKVPTSSEALMAYESNYSSGIAISKFMIGAGWFVVVVGVFAALLMGAEGGRYGPSPLLLALPGIGASISGFFMITAGQITKATLDNADHTAQIYKLLKSQQANKQFLANTKT